MTAEPRRRKIVETLATEGVLTIAELQRRFTRAPTAAERDAADAAAREIGEDETIFMDPSPFAFDVARRLARDHRPVLVVTNGLVLASHLSRLDTHAVKVVLTGGILLARAGAFVGPQAEMTIRSHYADRAVVDSTPDAPDDLTAIRHAMREHAQRTSAFAG